MQHYSRLYDGLAQGRQLGGGLQHNLAWRSLQLALQARQLLHGVLGDAEALLQVRVCAQELGLVAEGRRIDSETDIQPLRIQPRRRWCR